MYQDSLRDPIRNFVQGTRSHQTVEDQHQGDGAVIDRCTAGTVAADRLAHLETLQECVEDWQGAQLASQLGACEPVHQGRHRERPCEGKARQPDRPEETVAHALHSLTLVAQPAAPACWSNVTPPPTFA
jgi:hypothetical protein